jgi:hypothetical protein
LTSGKERKGFAMGNKNSVRRNRTKTVPATVKKVNVQGPNGSTRSTAEDHPMEARELVSLRVYDLRRLYDREGAWWTM